MLSLSKKSAQFRHLLPLIEEKLDYGYKYAEVTAILKVEHNLDMSINLFATYLHRYRPKTAKKLISEKVEQGQGLEKIITNPPVSVIPPPPVAKILQSPSQEQAKLKLAREQLAHDQQKLNLNDLLGAV